MSSAFAAALSASTASTSSSTPPRAYKARVFLDRDARRQQLLEQQKQARRDYTQHARDLLLSHRSSPALPASPSMDADSPPAPADLPSTPDDPAHRERSRLRRADYAAQFMSPQWMDAVPHDLSSGWYVLPRPEGTRCLVVSQHHRTWSRRRNGLLLHAAFSSALPGGGHHHHHAAAAASASSDDGCSSMCIVDCIWNEDSGRYYAVDLLAWKGYLLYDCTAEFRLYWMHQQLQALPVVQPPPPPPPPPHAAGSAAGKGRRPCFPIVPLPALACSEASLAAVYPMAAASSLLGCPQDGLLFVHKQAMYEPAALPTPLALVWRDARCSRWMGDASGPARAVLWYRDSAGWTEDGTRIGAVSGVTAADATPTVTPSRLIKVRLDGSGGDQLSEGQQREWRVHYEGEVGRGRVQADTLDKVTWQVHVRQSACVSMDDILEVIQHPDPVPPDPPPLPHPLASDHDMT